MGWVLLLFCTVSLAQEYVLRPEVNADPLFQEAALFVANSDQYRAAHPNPFLRVQSMDPFEGQWEYLASIYLIEKHHEVQPAINPNAKGYLFYVQDVLNQDCNPNQTVLKGEQRWSKRIQESDCHRNAHWVDMLDAWWTKDGCAILARRPNQKICVFPRSDDPTRIEHIRLYQQILL